ncbi:murein L,D-transpeptidase [Lichenibacterium minor]|uniref:Murein L,D-transpeptidase n=1 Tax=Lichenibacterium minor TaxID=2316528 RepID=A0A4Q2U7M8_9HYPH|nr:murein L,D-transpeptidase family protein [Lichenibacterium minor]RYC31918.1 murein L,D-transpeptidase [Lichenibacterium minor]
MKRLKPLRLLSALSAALALAGCAGDLAERVNIGSVYPDTVALMESENMDRGAPIFIRITKEDSTLEVWKEDRSGRYRPLKSYPVCHYSGVLGPKKAYGDHQAPEGFYSVAPNQMNPHSREYLSFNVGYPNAYDRSLGRTGDSLMVHGGCRSVGCYAMTNREIEEIYGLAHEAFAGGQTAISLQALPFRMTAANLDKHRDDPNAAFWAMLKTGSDAFDATHRPPQVAVCDHRYVVAPDGAPQPGGGSCSTV